MQELRAAQANAGAEASDIHACLLLCGSLICCPALLAALLVVTCRPPRILPLSLVPLVS